MLQWGVAIYTGPEESFNLQPSTCLSTSDARSLILLLILNQAVEDSAWAMAKTVETLGVSKWP